MGVEAAIQDVTHYRRIMEATEHQQAGRLSEARDIYLELLKDNPEDANSLHLLGMLVHQGGDSNQGIMLIEKALELIPDFPLYLNNLGHIYLSQQQLDKAEELFLKATRINTEMPAPLYGLGECYRRQGDLQHAANFIEYVLEREPQHVDAIVSLGLIHLQSNSAQKALELFEIASSIDSAHFGCKFQSARAHAALSSYDDTIRILQELLQQYPDHSPSYNILGNAYMTAGQFDKAIHAYQDYIVREPDDVNMRYNLAMAFMQLNQQNEAIEQLEVGLKINPNNNRVKSLLVGIRSGESIQ